MRNNQRRVLAQVLSIDAWHGPMKFDGSNFSVHVELNFRQGRIGGDDPDFPFTFNISLKRAILTLELENPLSIVRGSVARNIPSEEAQLTRILDAQKKITLSAELGGKINPASMAASLSGNASHSQTQSQEEQLKVVQTIPRIIALPNPLGPTGYSWELKPGHSGSLEGQPWDPIEEPRFAIKYTGANGKPNLEPVIKAFVSCKLEDVEIDDLKIKRDGIVSSFKEVAFHKINEAAAIQHLKLTLKDLELEAGDLDNRFSDLTIADVIVGESYD